MSSNERALLSHLFASPAINSQFSQNFLYMSKGSQIGQGQPQLYTWPWVIDNIFWLRTFISCFIISALFLSFHACLFAFSYYKQFMSKYENEWFYILFFCFFVTVFTIGKEFAVWTGSKSFWNYFGLGASQKSDYLSIVLFVDLVDYLIMVFLFENLMSIFLQFMKVEFPAKRSVLTMVNKIQILWLPTKSAHDT